jgi:hypothetical protein
MKPGRFTWHFGANPEANRIINNNPVITEITDQKSGKQEKKEGEKKRTAKDKNQAAFT